MKKIMISIRPEWVAKILNGEKTIEIRKTMPKCELPCEVYIYCTKPCGVDLAKFKWGEYVYLTRTIARDENYNINDIISDNLVGKVVAKFTLNKVDNSNWWKLFAHNSHEEIEKIFKQAQMTQEQLNKYSCTRFAFWYIDNLVIFDNVQTLADYGLTHAPQSWCYIEDIKNE